MASPPSPTIVFDFKYPDNPDAVAFQISIKVPHGMLQASAPSLSVASVTAPLQESEKMEFMLKQRLHERKLSQVDNAQTPSGMPNIANITPPPTSSSQSDKCTIESSEESTRDRTALHLQIPSTNVGDDRPSYRRGLAATSIDLERRLTEDPEASRSYDRVNWRSQPERLAPSSSHRSSSPPQTPPGSPRRVRTASPVRPSNMETNEDTSRGRAKSPRGMRNDDEASFKSRSPSHSRRSRSPSVRSRSPSRDSRYSNHSLHRDDMLVEPVSRSRSRSRSPPPRSTRPSPREEMFDSRRQDTVSRSYPTENVSLRHRISGQLSPSVPTKRHKHRICPFFHPKEGDKHPLDQPHPGYTEYEFNEAVRIHENGGDLPHSLIKMGVMVNLQNKGTPTRPTGPSWNSRGDISPTTTRSIRGPPPPPVHRSSYGGGETHVEPPLKRRKVEIPQENYRRESGSSYSSSNYARVADSMPVYGRQSSSQYPLTTGGPSDRYSRPAPRMMDSEPPRGMRPSYRRYASDQIKY